jgi:hypothetical protein
MLSKLIFIHSTIDVADKCLFKIVVGYACILDSVRDRFVDHIWIIEIISTTWFFELNINNRCSIGMNFVVVSSASYHLGHTNSNNEHSIHFQFDLCRRSILVKINRKNFYFYLVLSLVLVLARFCSLLHLLQFCVQ